MLRFLGLADVGVSVAALVLAGDFALAVVLLFVADALGFVGDLLGFVGEAFGLVGEAWVSIVSEVEGLDRGVLDGGTGVAIVDGGVVG